MENANPKKVLLKENRPPVPPRLSSKLTENVGFDKLSLNSPRPPLMSCNGGSASNIGSGGSPRTPQGYHKRKFASTTGNENASPCTPKSSLDGVTVMASGRNNLLRGRKIGGFKVTSESSLGSLEHSFPISVKVAKIANNENSEPTTSGGNSISPAISDLFNKPILSIGLSPLAEDQDDCFDASGEPFKQPSPRLNETYTFQNKRAKSYHYGNGAPVLLGYCVDTVDDEQESDVDEPVPSKLKVKMTIDVVSPTTKLNRSVSESALKSAVERIESDPTLVGDGSRSFILPLIAEGKHNDLREITAGTLVSLMEGKYAEAVSSYRVIDCRYPYEYDGGHIRDAINLHTRRQVYNCLIEGKKPKFGSTHVQREILIFHCEFSSKRGPDLCRYLRQADRHLNEQSFPSLHFPELYVLYGGYKSFFHHFEAHCEPPVYITMVDEKYSSEYRRYKSMSKTDVVVLKTTANSKMQKKKSMRQASMNKLNFDSL